MQKDAVTIAPHIHKVVFEDDGVRVFEVIINPGEKAEMHWHPRNIAYVIEGGKLRFINEKGESKEVELADGQVTSSEETNHAVENIGRDTVKVIQVEFK